MWNDPKIQGDQNHHVEEAFEGQNERQCCVPQHPVPHLASAGTARHILTVECILTVTGQKPLLAIDEMMKTAAAGEDAASS